MTFLVVKVNQILPFMQEHSAIHRQLCLEPRLGSKDASISLPAGNFSRSYLQECMQVAAFSYSYPFADGNEKRYKKVSSISGAYPTKYPSVSIAKEAISLSNLW